MNNCSLLWLFSVLLQFFLGQLKLPLLLLIGHTLILNMVVLLHLLTWRWVEALLASHTMTTPPRCCKTLRCRWCSNLSLWNFYFGACVLASTGELSYLRQFGSLPLLQLLLGSLLGWQETGCADRSMVYSSMMLLLKHLKFGHKHIIFVSIAPAIIVNAWLMM